MPARITPKQKETIVRLRNEGMTIKGAADVAGVSYRWAKAFFAGLPDDGGKAYRDRKLELTIPHAAIPYEKLSEEARKGWDDFEYFRRRYLGHISTPWQLEAAAQIIEAYESPEREYMVINVAPGAGKSTLLTDLAAWMTVRNRAIRGLYVCRSMSLANRSLMRVRRSLDRTTPVRARPEEIEKGMACDAEATIAHDYGRFRPDHGTDVWRREEFIVVQADGAPIEEKEPTWSAFGFDQGYLGNRFEIMLADDLDDKSTTRTLEVVENNRRTFDEELETRLEPGGLIANCQQRLGRNDFSAHCLSKVMATDDDDEGDSTEDEVPQYRQIVYKAHFTDRCSGEHRRDAPAYPDGCLLDPRRITWKDIRRAMGNRTRFAVVYQQEEADPADVLVRPIWISGGSDDQGHYIGCWDRDRGLWEVPSGISGRTVATVDPSPTRMWAVQVWHIDPESQTRWLLALYNGRMSASEFLDHREGVFSGLAEDFQRMSIEIGHPIDTWIFEINAAQRFFLSTDYVERWQRERGTSFLPHTTHRNKVDPKMGPGILSNPWRYGQVRLPGRPDSRHRVMTLVDQVTRWTPSQEMTDDQVMANWFLELHLPDLIRPRETNLRLWRPSWASEVSNNELALRGGRVA